MEVKERVIEGDERTLVLFQALLNQVMSLEDIFVFLSLKGKEKEQFLKRNDLLDKLSDIETLKITIGKRIEELVMERVKNMKNNMNYINSHETNRQVFQDTMNWIKNDSKLNSAVKSSINKQFVWKQGAEFPLKTEEKAVNKTAKVFTSSKRTLEAAERYAKTGKKVAVLNFANNHHAGGGVWGGANAQEECICRCSTLYPCISDTEMLKDFYEYHSSLFENHRLDFTGNDDLIYTPDVVVCKTDSPVPERMAEKNWYKVDVITCAAPNLRGLWFDDEKEYHIHLARFTAILEAARRMGNEVVILGAFGCGAFANRPEIVAHAAFDALRYYKSFFDTVEFAVFATERDTENYREFVKIFGEENLEKEDLELYKKYRKDLYLPAGKITVSICEEVKCPVCNLASKKFTSSSPEWTWQHLCGKSKTFWICPKCKKILVEEDWMN